VGFVAPRVLVLGSVVDQQQHGDDRQTFHQTVEPRLGFRIDPVQVFEHQHQGAFLAFTLHQALQGIVGTLPALGGIKLVESMVIGRRIAQCQQGWRDAVTT
jgi:hypothetical protein